jgi:hypothetical protein
MTLEKTADAMLETPSFPLLHDYPLTAARINKQMTLLLKVITTAYMQDNILMQVWYIYYSK